MRFQLNISVLQRNIYNKIIWNYVETLEICKSVFSILKFHNALNNILNDNGKTI